MANKRAFPAPVRALAHRNFRLYFAGQAVSILGSWIQQVAMSWLVYRLTGSAALLGITSFFGLIPQLVVGPLAGAWIDKHDKKKWLIGVQSLMALQALVLAVLTGMKWIDPPFIVAMALCLGILSSFDAPLRQSLLGSFVGSREDLPNALALNAMLFNAGRFIGPPIAGLLLSLTSETFCFAINALSFLALIAAIKLVRNEPPPRATGSVGDVFKEGVAYAWQTWTVRMLILTLIVMNMTASSYVVLLPIFAREIFGGDATTLGWLWGAAGCGAFLSTVFLTTRKETALIPSIVFGTLTGAIALFVFSSATWFGLALCGMAGLGFGITVCNVGINMVLQSTSPERLRGRVVSFFTAARFGFDALGGLLAGFVAARLGARSTLLLESGVLFVFVLFLLTKRSRLHHEILESHRSMKHKN